MKPVDLEGDTSGGQRFTHVLEELNLRAVPYNDDAIIRSMYPPKPKSPKVVRALNTLSARNWPPDILVKFGKREYMADLLLAGRGRVSLATSYDDPSLGHARSDNESRLFAYPDPADAHHFFVTDQHDRTAAGDLDVAYLGSAQIHVRATTDFYVYCLAGTADASLFDDFDADTCIVITKPSEFKARIQTAVSARLPNWKFIAGPVIYFDPFFCHAHQIVPHFWKHFRFSYQKEHRLVWLPPKPDCSGETTTKHVQFDVGPLTDCARLIWL